MKRIAFVTDGGSEMGMGHIQQSLTLAQELKERTKIFFLTKSDKTIVSHIHNSGFDVIHRISDDELLGVLSYIAPQLVIIDKINVEEDFARKIREELKIKLAIFTNITPANRYADIAVTADFGSYFKNVKFFDETTKTLYYFGPRYWILRKDFYELKKRAKRVPDRIEKILLIFGGSDPLNLTSAVLEKLLQMQEYFLIDLIIGICFTFDNELNKVLGKYPNERKKVNIFRNIKNVAEMMYAADLVITSPGLALFEALLVGTPVIAFHQNTIQKDRTAEVYRGFIPTLDKNQIIKLPDIISSKNFIDPRDDFIVKMAIGQGKEEVIEELLKGVVSNAKNSAINK